MTRFLEDVAQHGNARLSDEAEEAILDDLRQAAALLFDAPSSTIAVVGGASEGLGQIAAALATSSSEVVLVGTDFPSVTYPWLGAQRRLGSVLRWAQDEPTCDLTSVLVDAISDCTSVVCFGAVQYATGTAVDVGTVVKRAHEVGAKAIVDVTQLAGADVVRVREWSPDAVVCSGYKWLSGHGGVALLSLSDEFITTPPFIGWKGTEHPFEFDAMTLALARDARRFELSTIAYCSATGLVSSIAMLLDVGVPTLAQHSLSLAHELVDQVRPLGWQPFRAPGEVGASNHIVSLRHETLDAAKVQATLAAEHRVIVSSRRGSLRVSLHGYNDSSDVEALVDALAVVGRRAS
jgi:cysteine desulfurase / selenocysteine lyase